MESSITRNNNTNNTAGALSCNVVKFGRSMVDADDYDDESISLVFDDDKNNEVFNRTRKEMSKLLPSKGQNQRTNYDDNVVRKANDSDDLDESSTSIGDPSIIPNNHMKGDILATSVVVQSRRMQRRCSTGTTTSSSSTTVGSSGNKLGDYIQSSKYGGRYQPKTQQQLEQPKSGLYNNRNVSNKNGDDDDDEDESIDQSAVCSVPSRYFSDPSVVGSVRPVSDGSISHSSVTSLDLMSAFGQKTPMQMTRSVASNPSPSLRRTTSAGTSSSPSATAASMIRSNNIACSPSPRNTRGINTSKSSPLTSLAYAATGNINQPIQSPRAPLDNSKRNVVRSKSTTIGSPPKGNENDIKLRNALNRIGTSSRRSTSGGIGTSGGEIDSSDDDDANFLRQFDDTCNRSIEDLKEMFSGSKRNLRPKQRKKRAFNKSGSAVSSSILLRSQSSLSMSTEDLVKGDVNCDDSSSVDSASVNGGADNRRNNSDSHLTSFNTSVNRRSIFQASRGNRLNAVSNDNDSNSYTDNDGESVGSAVDQQKKVVDDDDDSGEDIDHHSPIQSDSHKSNTSIFMLDESGTSFAKDEYYGEIPLKSHQHVPTSTTLLGPDDTGPPSSPEINPKRGVTRSPSKNNHDNCNRNNSQQQLQLQKQQHYQQSHQRLGHESTTSSRFNMSCETLPVTNVARTMSTTSSIDDSQILGTDKRRAIESSKRSQVIESLVWFSFHMPRTVLEDLISHELELWRQHSFSTNQPNPASPTGTGGNNKKEKSKRNAASQQQQKNNLLVLPKLISSNGHKKGSKNKSSLSNTNHDDSNSTNNDGDAADDVSYNLGGGGGSGSVSSLSDVGLKPLSNENQVYDANYSEAIMRREGKQIKTNDMMILPNAVQRESAILFVDMSGFTKLSTLLDVESLSKVINTYFDMIVSEVISFGGDILKFAGDAFFAEWRVNDDDTNSLCSKFGQRNEINPLSELNASLASINEILMDDDSVPASALAVLSAAKCASSIVQKYSDYHVTTSSGGNATTTTTTTTTSGNGTGPNNGSGTGSNDTESNSNNNNANTNNSMLNVHCGIGYGYLVGLHVGDYKESADEEETTELRREFLLLGDPIEQVAKATEIATDGQVMASTEAMLALAFCCDLTEEQLMANRPVCIASRNEIYLKHTPTVVVDTTNALQPYESLRMHCKSLNHSALARLNLQMALYVHPVIRGDELALSAAIQAGKIVQPTETIESRHRAEAELRSVFTMFITPVISPRITGIPTVDQGLYKTLGDIMHVTSRELDRYSGHLRQFIVDDKGVVLIATFGLRGSTFPNMVENNALPAAFAIHKSLKTELSVDNRIGCTFGKVYCGVVGGVRRHEFAVMGAPVNLAARLMGSKVNNGILVDEAVREQCMGRYTFKSLPPVTAKGYDKPVPILEPIHSDTKASKKKQSSFRIIGRRAEKRTVISVARGIIEEPMIAQSTMIFLTGESGMGKSALAVTILDELKKGFTEERAVIVTARSSSTETEQRIPLGSFRKIFMSVMRDRCEYDTEFTGKASICSSNTTGKSILSCRSQNNTNARRGQLVASRMSLADNLPKQKGGLYFEKGIEDSVSEFDCSPVSNKSSRSMRRAVAPPGLSQVRQRQNQNLKNSLGMSTHSKHSNGTSADKNSRRKSDFLSHSLHQSTQSTDMPNRRQSFTPRLHLARAQSMRKQVSKLSILRDDCEESLASLDTNFMKQGTSANYFEKLCWACDQINYPFEYADIVGSQFLGFENATPITHVDGHVPTMDELVEFLAQVFIALTDHADLITIFLDDFHWVDAFSWKIFRVLCKKANKLILLSATRSHDKQALRRMSSAATQEPQLQSQMIEISLGPLDFSEIRELMAVVLDHKKSSIPDALCTDIFQRTGGLPVYVVQVLENIKRNQTVELVDGILKWTTEGLVEKRKMATSKNGAVIEETFLSRFDALDVRVRKVLQTCAVLGLSFALTDVIKVHPEIEEFDIENALECAMDEMILVEQVEDDDDEHDNASNRSHSSKESGDDFESQHKEGSTDNRGENSSERFFQFSHAMWRKSVLATMLKERKMELHRLIAEAMEKDEVMILDQSDISRLLTLFDHWKSCGEFCKVAPLALAVGARLEEWDLAAQSLELYEDALEMAIDGVQATEREVKEEEEWVQVKAKPIVLDLILRLHICMGMCHQRLGQEYQSILYFQDAYNIIKSASKMSGMSEALVMPIISSLCVLILEEEESDPQSRAEHIKLIETFVREAKEDGEQVHIGRSLALQALHFAKLSDFRAALETVRTLEDIYDVEEHCNDMIAEYGRDFAMECVAESIQWLYLIGNHDEAETKAETIIDQYLPILEPQDSDQMMYVLLPIIQVFSLLDRAEDADVLLKKMVINPYHDCTLPSSEFWAPLFSPLAYLLEIIIMDDEEQHDQQVLDEMEKWILDEENLRFEKELERKAQTIIGELCWRLALVKEDDEEGQMVLLQKARDLLEPVAMYPHNEIFQKQTAQALLEAL